MRRLIPVEGRPDLARDPITNVIVSINNKKAEQTKELYQHRQKEREEIDQLKTDVQEIKQLLLKLIENGSNG